MKWLLLLFALNATAADAPPPFVVQRTEVRKLTSRENGVAYKLYVSLPHGYGEKGKTFPAVYLLDADYSFLIARNITDHLAERGDLEELIVVGIAYDTPKTASRAWQSEPYHRNRTRDYTPKFSPKGGYGPEMQKVSGGGPKFRAFIEKELIPFIDANYATVRGDRTLVGHSYGGLFAAWNVITSPPLFQRYIIVSPSLWYADRWIFGLPFPKSLKARVYLGVGSSEGNSEHDMVVDLKRFAEKLHDINGISVSSTDLDGETHNSVFPRALSNGLRFVFEEEAPVVETLTLTSKVFGNTRTIRVLLPPGYSDSRNARRRYPVLYLNDGVTVFKPSAMDVATVMADVPMIVVGIDNGASTNESRNPNDRTMEYLPYPDVGFGPDHFYKPDPAAPRGDLYPSFLIDEVMPLVSAHYRIATGPENTGIGGSSYGGVAALYAVLSHPGVFGKLMLESTPLWIGENKALLQQASRATSWPERVYVGIGAAEADDAAINAEGKSDIDALLRAIHEASPSTKTHLEVDPAGKHNAASWRRRMPAALQFLFGRNR